MRASSNYISLFLLSTLMLMAIPALADNVETALMPGQVIEGHAKWEEDCAKCHKRFDKGAQNALCQDCHKDIRKDVEQKQGSHGRFKGQRDCKSCHTEHKGRAENIAPMTDQTFDHERTDFPLKGAHANTKKVECKACHKSKAKYRDAPSDCYACHKKDDKHKENLGPACSDCHTEKNWKETAAKFNHDKTRYPLRGKHIDAKCQDCHANERYKNTPMDCFSCHKKDDKHKGQEGTKCEECHDDRSWKKSPFDHNKSRFPLMGKHAKIECKKCHLTPAFKDAPLDCYACHKKDDKHKGTYGEKCETCHAESDWKTITFDHDLHSKYPLRGRHIATKCESCHKGHLYKDTTPVACLACHKKDDKHKGQFAEQCETCHTERNWKLLLFEHDHDTKYPLRGKHRTTRCESCHKGHLYKDTTPVACLACHKKDDKHKGQFAEQCETCHTERNWKLLLFEHDHDTTYPLQGKHRTTTCESCHTGRLYQDKTPTACYACHKLDDVHRRRLGTECQSCHSIRDWKLWDFDHDTRTRFKLEGGHKGVECAACHKDRMEAKVKTSAQCVSCHKKDDKHEGNYGLQCERCHDTSIWKSLKPGTGSFRFR
ncbi:MAG: cytochrome C [Nitrospirota bacterium]|nr:cytochrome C [Nitrospirota bacterium]